MASNEDDLTWKRRLFHLGPITEKGCCVLDNLGQNNVQCLISLKQLGPALMNNSCLLSLGKLRESMYSEINKGPKTDP